MGILLNSLYGGYRTRTFSDIFPTAQDFINEFHATPFDSGELRDDNKNLLYYHLYATYGNSHISYSDENQFKYKMFAIISNKGTIWQKNLDTQKKMRDLTDEEIQRVGTSIYNHAENPGQLSEHFAENGEAVLQYINAQEVQHQNIAKMDALRAYMNVLLDVTTRFIDEFRDLFLKFVAPERPLLYITDAEGVEIYE